MHFEILFSIWHQFYGKGEHTHMMKIPCMLIPMNLYGISTKIRCETNMQRLIEQNNVSDFEILNHPD